MNGIHLKPVLGALLLGFLTVFPTPHLLAQSSPSSAPIKRLVELFNPRPPEDLISIKGFLEKLKTALADGADIDAADEYGNTPLVTAVYWGPTYTDIVAMLLLHGAYPNVFTAGVTPLHMAALHAIDDSSVTTIELLCAAGADPDAKSLMKIRGYPEGVTPAEIIRLRRRESSKVMTAMETCTSKNKVHIDSKTKASHPTVADQ